MKKIICLVILLFATAAFAQKRALRVDSLEVSDTFILTGNGSNALIESDLIFLFNNKMLGGELADPIDVTTTRQYGLEFYFGGNNYDVTGMRIRGLLQTTDASTKTAQGILAQASNSDGIDALVVQGALIEGIGKSSTTQSTTSTLRGALVNTEWSAKDIVTDLKTLHVRTHTRASATEGYISNTGYLVYLENEAVGGNGQQLDAGIYLKATNVSTPYAFDYGIDFSGAVGEIATAEINLSNGETISNLVDGDILINAGQVGIGTAPTDSALHVSGGGYFTGGISVLNINDRTNYIGEKEAIALLKKVNLTGVKDFSNQDDVFVLPYELRDRQYRSLSNCVSLLLAVVKSQQAEIEKLKKRVK